MSEAVLNSKTMKGMILELRLERRDAVALALAIVRNAVPIWEREEHFFAVKTEDVLEIIGRWLEDETHDITPVFDRRDEVMNRAHTLEMGRQPATSEKMSAGAARTAAEALFYVLEMIKAEEDRVTEILVVVEVATAYAIAQHNLIESVGRINQTLVDSELLQARTVHAELIHAYSLT